MIGHRERGCHLCSGKFPFAGGLVDAPDLDIWDIEMPDAAFERELHGFSWLDDLAAAGDRAAEDRALSWTRGWIRRFGRGNGPGWQPEQTGQRVIRWINHLTLFLSDGEGTGDWRWREAFRRSLGHQVAFLSDRWQNIPRGLSRIEALAGLVHASLVLVGKENDWDYFIEALANEADGYIDADGGVSTRNPEELLDVLSLLIQTLSVSADASRISPKRILDTVGRFTPTLRSLRHSDGGLARFQGGGRGVEGRLDHALANSGTPRRDRTGLAMGFARLSSGRTSLIMDTAPPSTEIPGICHASIMAFEMTVGRHPLIVNCGSGIPYGVEWAKAGRLLAAHSALDVEENPSSDLGGKRTPDRAGIVTATVPRDVRVRLFSGLDGKGVQASHDGYVPTHGMIHIRAIDLSPDGGRLTGHDTLTAASDDEIRRFERIRHINGRPGFPFSIRFHLHPDVTIRADATGRPPSLLLGNGETWTFRHSDTVAMSLEPSVYMENDSLAPRETNQIVLLGHAIAHVTHVHWILERRRKSPVYLRDLAPDKI